MKIFRFKTIQQRLVFFLLIPATCGLLVAGLIGFFYVRESMLKQWNESALLKLERAAHYINMRLSLPIERIQLLSSASGVMTRQILLDEIKTLPGVSDLKIEWKNSHGSMTTHQPSHDHFEHEMMRFHRTVVSKVTKPEFDANAGLEYVTILTSLLDSAGNEVGRLIVKLEFDYLIEDIFKLGWWQSDMACLVTKDGTYLLHTNMEMDGRIRLGETEDILEKDLLDAISDKDYGTLMGPGYPPEMVAGFHSLTMAPWTIILYAPGEKILEPIVRFQVYFFLGSLFLISYILFLIRLNVAVIVKPIRTLSKSAGHVARGDYGEPIKQESDDEIGQLINSYNAMVVGLKERDFIRNTFGLYMDEDVARDLLSKHDTVKLGGEQREVVILMSDIRGFTPLSEVLKPEDTIRLLNNYFKHMIDVIKTHRGIIVDFVGDAVLVFFDSISESTKSTAFRAVCCALEMQAEMDRFNQEMTELELPQLEMGIGMNSGEVIVGNIGSESRVKYGIVGAPVNLTQRIQEKAQGKEILISEPLLNNLQETVIIDSCIEVNMRGVNSQMKLYTITGIQKTGEFLGSSKENCTKQ